MTDAEKAARKLYMNATFSMLPLQRFMKTAVDHAIAAEADRLRAEADATAAHQAYLYRVSKLRERRP